MDISFKKATLLARAVEQFHEHSKQRFDRLTKHVTKGSRDMALMKMSAERIQESLDAYNRDIDESGALLSELRSMIVRLSEMPTTTPRSNGREIEIG